MPDAKENAGTETDAATVRATRMGEHLSRLLDLYKDHYALFIKGAIVYLAAVAVIAGYMFGPAAKHEHDGYFAAIVIGASAIWLGAALISLRWWHDATTNIDAICNELELSSYPLKQDRSIMISGAAVGLAMIIAMTAYMLWPKP